MKLQLLLITILFCHKLFAGGDLVNNGGGLAERNVLYAYQNLEFSMKLCLDTNSCHLNTLERELLQKINAGIVFERGHKSQLKFISEIKNPGTFILEGEMKVAITGSLPGSDIFVNTDLLYTKNQGRIEALSVHEAIAMLVHEFGHHYGTETHTELDLLGLKVAQQLTKTTYNTPLLPSGGPISAVFINGEAGTSFPEVLLYGNQQMFNLTESLKATIGCQMVGIPIQIGPIPPILFPVKKPKAFQVSNVYWSEIPRSNKGAFKIKGSLTNYCEKNSIESLLNRKFKFEITFFVKQNISNDKNSWAIDESTIKIAQVEDPWIRILEFGIF